MIQQICSTNFRAELNSVIRLRRVGRFESHGVRYLVGRIKRYPDSTSTFQLTRVAISGDVSLNPGPRRSPSVMCVQERWQEIIGLYSVIVVRG